MALNDAPVTLDGKEVELVKKLISDWGREYDLDANREDVKALARKLGFVDAWIDWHL